MFLISCVLICGILFKAWMIYLHEILFIVGFKVSPCIFRCCQNGLVSVWTVPQNICSYPESVSSESEGWWENEAKPRFMVHIHK